jgi:hypothetical protein
VVAPDPMLTLSRFGQFWESGIMPLVTPLWILPQHIGRSLRCALMMSMAHRLNEILLVLLCTFTISHFFYAGEFLCAAFPGSLRFPRPLLSLTSLAFPNSPLGANLSTLPCNAQHCHTLDVPGRFLSLFSGGCNASAPPVPGNTVACYPAA